MVSRILSTLTLLTGHGHGGIRGSAIQPLQLKYLVIQNPSERWKSFGYQNFFKESNYSTCHRLQWPASTFFL